MNRAALRAMNRAALRAVSCPMLRAVSWATLRAVGRAQLRSHAPCAAAPALANLVHVSVGEARPLYASCHDVVVLLEKPWYTPAMHVLATASPFRLWRMNAGRTFFHPPGSPFAVRPATLGLALGGLLCLFGLTATSCNGDRPPDPYLGTVDGLGTADHTAFDPIFRGGLATGKAAGCLVPRRGYAPTGPDAAPISWFYMGTLSPTQLDISNATDPTRTLPASAYSITGCSPQGDVNFDERTDNYVRSLQYPVLADTNPEPTSAASYKPWQFQVKAAVSAARHLSLGCNDIKSERSVQDRGGYDKVAKTWGNGDSLDLNVTSVTPEQVRAGMVTFKDWPMYYVGTPILKTQTAACPLSAAAPPVKGSTDPAAMFYFPSKSWQRGLLNGYLDGGDVPLSQAPTMDCPFPNGQTCGSTRPCEGGSMCDADPMDPTATGNCIGLPVCPKINDLYVSSEVLTKGKVDASILAAGTVTLTDPMDMTKTRTADLIAVFGSAPGAGFSPVCRLQVYDPAKVTCSRKEGEAIAPRPICTVAEIMASPMGAILKLPTTYVHCLVLQSTPS